ncbi:hypothetical protein KP509_37G054400 [Ceratopteris richardii]|uniref:ORC6 second cyclin-like domain-containing protein n=1 Tax=Ceratopteris richardii TaxID=49495 RepID=A0A8T2Q876_CERRI|nr:hypothetical protein KP509_37G054400 [Ceratopteris richardii]
MEYKQRFLAGLPESRKSYADFSRGVFVAVAFYFCAKRNKVKVDKLRLIEICGTSESEFASVSSSMLNLCYDLLGLEREKIESPSAANVKTAKVCASKRKKLDYASYVGGLDLPEDQVSEVVTHPNLHVQMVCYRFSSLSSSGHTIDCFHGFRAMAYVCRKKFTLLWFMVT